MFKNTFNFRIFIFFLLFLSLSISLVYGYYSGESLRVPVGQKNTYDDLQEKMYKNNWVPINEKAPKIPKNGGAEKDSINIRTAPVGTIIYFDSKGQRLDYTIEICKGGIIKLWLNHQKGCHAISFKALKSSQWVGDSLIKTPGAIKCPGVIAVPYFDWARGKLIDVNHPNLYLKPSAIAFNSFEIFYPEVKEKYFKKLFENLEFLRRFKQNI